MLLCSVVCKAMVRVLGDGCWVWFRRWRRATWFVAKDGQAEKDRRNKEVQEVCSTLGGKVVHRHGELWFPPQAWFGPNGNWSGLRGNDVTWIEVFGRYMIY